MSYTKPYIPRADAALRTFALSFAENIAADPAKFGLVQAEAASIMQACTAFVAALEVSSNPAMRTRDAIVAKDDARSILLDRIRSYAAFIRDNRGVTDGDKLTIGVRPRTIAHNKRTCPTTAPLLNYVGALPGVDQLVYHSSDTPDSKAKPRGAERLELWVAYQRPGEPQPKVSQATLVGSFKKSKMLVDQDVQRDSRMEGDGKPTYWARWAGYDGSVGPWSLPCRLSALKKQEPKKKSKEKATGAEADDQSLRKAA